MFYKKDIPTSLEECYEVDAVSKKLSQWADWLKIWGKRVLIILIVFGIFSTIEDNLDILFPSHHIKLCRSASWFPSVFAVLS